MAFTNEIYNLVRHNRIDEALLMLSDATKNHPKYQGEAILISGRFHSYQQKIGIGTVGNDEIKEECSIRESIISLVQRITPQIDILEKTPVDKYNKKIRFLIQIGRLRISYNMESLLLILFAVTVVNYIYVNNEKKYLESIAYNYPALLENKTNACNSDTFLNIQKPILILKDKIDNVIGQNSVTPEFCKGVVCLFSYDNKLYSLIEVKPKSIFIGDSEVLGYSMIENKALSIPITVRTMLSKYSANLYIQNPFLFLEGNLSVSRNNILISFVDKDTSNNCDTANCNDTGISINNINGDNNKNSSTAVLFIPTMACDTISGCDTANPNDMKINFKSVNCTGITFYSVKGNKDSQTEALVIVTQATPRSLVSTITNNSIIKLTQVRQFLIILK